MTRRAIAALTFLGLVAPALAQAQVALVPTEYAVKFQVSVPPGWETTRDANGARLMSFEPSANTADTFRENVSIIYDGMPAGMTSAEYRRQSVATMAGQVPSFALVDSGEVTLAGRKVYRVRYGFVMNAVQIRSLVYLIEQAGRVYFITATSTPAAYAAHEPLFERIIGSFRAE